MNYKNRKNKIEDDEVLRAEDEKIRALLGGLKRVAAPNDFDFRLKARIARAKPNRYRASPFLPALRYVLPLGLVILVSAFVVFNGVYFADTQSVQPIAEKRFEVPAATNTSSDSSAESARQSIENAAPAPQKPETFAVSNPAKTASKNKQKSDESTLIAAAESGKKPKAPTSSGKKTDAEDAADDSRTSDFTRAKITTPPGINPNKTVRSSPNLGGAKAPDAKEILLLLGIEAVFTNEKWKVKSVAQNSLAERSGIKIGDAVEAIDGEKLTDKPLGRGTIGGKILTVARGSEKIEISLVNKSN